MSTYSNSELQNISREYSLMRETIYGCPHIDEQGLRSIEEAYLFALGKYDGKYLESGKPYMLHLIEMAKIAVLEVGLGYTTVVCVFLHGITYKAGVSLYDIEQRFGKNAAIIIDGFDKVSKLDLNRLSFQSDTFRKLFLSLVQDMRSVLLKVVHRLYDVRNQHDISPERLNAYIQEIKYLYIPVVHRLGLYIIKAEFEEKVMLYENPEIFHEIERKINATVEQQIDRAEKFLKPIKEDLDAERERTKKKDRYKFSYSVKWRTKSVPSIYAKMKAQNVSFEQVYDLFAVRIIIDCDEKDEKECCWMTYSIITNRYEPNLKRLRDWITIPKASGYESLHITVNQDDKYWVEVQIRTVRMDEVAEKGQAAHYLYKAKNAKPISSEEWLIRVREMLENPEQMIFDEFYHDTKKNKSDKIFIFTPSNDLKQLPIGSTVLDFAYEIHTQVGDTCNGAKVNGRVVPIRYVLNNGDKVEIIKSKKQSPRADWLNYVTTDKAKNKIKRFLQEEELREAELGKELLLRRLKNWKIPFSDDTISQLVKEYKLENALQLYHKISIEQIDLVSIKKILLNDSDKDNKTPKAGEPTEPIKKSHDNDQDNFLSIGDDIKNVNYKMAKCCNPLHGDDVFGFVTSEGVISIHRTNCPNAKSLQQRYGYRLMNVRWKKDQDQLSLTTLKIIGRDHIGLLRDITNVISSDLQVNMKNIALDSTDKDSFEGKIVIEISDIEALNKLISRLKEIKGVDDVIRYN